MSVDDPGRDPADADRYAVTPQLPRQTRRLRRRIMGNQRIHIVEKQGQTRNTQHLRIFLRREGRERNVSLHLPDAQAVSAMIRSQHPEYSPAQLLAETVRWLRQHERRELLKLHEQAGDSSLRTMPGDLE